MVTIKKKIDRDNEYYYLEHSIRKKGKIVKKEQYLGTALPDNIEKLKKEFLSEIYDQELYPILENIRKNYAKEDKSMSISVREKHIEEFMIKFTYETQRIEGSTLTLKETADLLERGITPKSKHLGDVKEAESHKQVFYEMLKCEKELSSNIVLYWHKKLLENTRQDIAGQIRKHQVGIARSKFIPPLAIEVYPMLMDFFEWYKKNKDKTHPIELAALVHLKFVTIHPFADGNGRISRLIMNFILNKHKYPMLNIEYKNRSSYYNALERSQAKKQERIFLQWFLRRYIKQNKRFLKQ